jgi:ketosteroid isomerase-like protein
MKMLLWLLLAIPALAETEEKVIVEVLVKSAADWSRGDLDAFLAAYEMSPDTTFVGTAVTRGTNGLRARYLKAYPDATHMGKTTFSELEVRPLSSSLAIVTGRYKLERKTEFGGEAHGIFTLVMRKGPKGWRIIHDHTSSLP